MGLFNRNQNSNYDPSQHGWLYNFARRAAPIAANLFIPGSGLALRAGMGAYDRMSPAGHYMGPGSGYTGADRAAVNGPALSGPSYQSPNLGFGPTSPQPSGNYDQMFQDQTMNTEAAMQARMQARMEAARNGQPQQPGAQAPAQQAPMTPDQQRRLINAQYLDQSTALANSNYGQDIGFIAPQARAPRER